MISISIYTRLLTVYKIIGKYFGKWISPIVGIVFILILRLLIAILMFLDQFIFFKLNKINISEPIIIVGNPRSGTTLLHQILASHKDVCGAGETSILHDQFLEKSSIAL